MHFRLLSDLKKKKKKSLCMSCGHLRLTKSCLFIVEETRNKKSHSLALTLVKAVMRIIIVIIMRIIIMYGK